MKRYKVYEIKWDCNDIETKLQLPTEMVIEDENDHKYNPQKGIFDLSDFLSDKISDITGFTHYGFCFDEIK